MRIIAGAFKGRRLKEFDGGEIRPTSDRVREALFNLLMHGNYGGREIIDQHVVDLCCGTGALGLEALSRGARSVTFVDRDKKSLQLARDNALHCGATQQSFFLQADVARLPPAREPAMLVLFDAPYADTILTECWAGLRAGNWLAPGALLVAELPSDPPALDGATLENSRRYGKRTAVHLFRADA